MKTQYIVTKRRWSLARGATFTICLVLLPLPSLRADDRSVREAFKTQYEPHAKDLWDFYAHFKAKIVDTEFRSNGKHRVRTGEAICSGNSFLLKVHNERRVGDAQGSPVEETIVEGMNSRYGFTLGKKGGTDFVVKEVKKLRPGERGDLCYLTSPVASPLYGKEPYLELTGDLMIRFVSFEDGPWQGKPAKKLQIQFDRPPKKNTAKPVTVDVSYFFSPEEGWICRGIRVQVVGKPHPAREDIFFYEQRANLRFPPLKRVEIWMRNSKGPMLASATDITEFEHHAPFPESDFTLSAFGLPEPYGVVWKKPIPWYLWFIGIALVFLTLGWFFRRRVQRRSTMIAPHSPTPAG
jgi:hypothetical protein